MNNDHDREFKGAFTNVASFDNEDMNIVAYTDGQISSGPKLFKLKENEHNQLMFKHDDNKVRV